MKTTFLVAPFDIVTMLCLSGSASGALCCPRPIYSLGGLFFISIFVLNGERENNLNSSPLHWNVTSLIDDIDLLIHLPEFSLLVKSHSHLLSIF